MCLVYIYIRIYISLLVITYKYIIIYIYIYISQSSLLITVFPFKNHNWIILEVSSPGARLSMILCILLSLQTLHICLRPQLHGKIRMASMEVSWNFLFE